MNIPYFVPLNFTSLDKSFYFTIDYSLTGANYWFRDRVYLFTPEFGIFPIREFSHSSTSDAFLLSAYYLFNSFFFYFHDEDTDKTYLYQSKSKFVSSSTFLETSIYRLSQGSPRSVILRHSPRS